MSYLYKVKYIDNSDPTNKVRTMDIAGDSKAAVERFIKKQKSLRFLWFVGKAKKITTRTKLTRHG